MHIYTNADVYTIALFSDQNFTAESHKNEKIETKLKDKIFSELSLFFLMTIYSNIKLDIWRYSI